MKEYWPVYGLNIVPNSNWDFNQVFENIETNSESKGNSDNSPHRNVILDIGFGNGQSILSMSKSNPSTGFVGVEVYKPGICGTMKQLATLNGPLQQNNVKLVYGDVITVLADSVCERSLQKVLIFFPDPFPSHPNRRIVRPLLASLLASRIKIGGTLHIATDVEDYAVHVMSIMDSSTSKALGWTGGICKARPDWRPHTMYENIALSEGREIFDFCYYLGPSLN